MSDQVPELNGAQPAQQTQSAPPFGNAYAQQPYPYRAPTRPPLSKKAKRGTVWAGAVGFNLLTIGFYLVVVPLIAAMFGAFFSLMAKEILRSGRGSGAGAEGISDFFDSLDVGLLVLLGVAAVLIGLAIMWAGLFVSKSILSSHGVHRPWPVTWAGVGIAVAAFWMLGWIPTVIGQFVSFLVLAGGTDTVVGFSIGGGVVVLGTLIGNAAIGWLSWWWMAHVLRASESAPLTNTTVSGTAITDSAVADTALAKEI